MSLRRSRISNRCTTWPDAVKQACQPESGFGELLARNRGRLAHVSIIQLDRSSGCVCATVDAGRAGFDGNSECLVNLSTSQLIRFPGDVVGSTWFPRVGIFLASVQLFELVCGGVWVS